MIRRFYLQYYDLVGNKEGHIQYINKTLKYNHTNIGRGRQKSYLTQAGWARCGRVEKREGYTHISAEKASVLNLRDQEEVWAAKSRDGGQVGRAKGLVFFFLLILSWLIYDNLLFNFYKCDAFIKGNKRVLNIQIYCIFKLYISCFI